MKKIALFLLTLSLLTSCVKDSFDTPAAIGDPNLNVNYSISRLKSEYKASGKSVMNISQDYIISGIVTADDKSNNFYKEIVLQDSNGAIGIKIDRTNLYNDFPVGRRIFIKLKGLAIGHYNSLIQLGGYVDTVTVPGSSSLGAIPSGKINDFIIKGSLGHQIQPEEVTIPNLNDDYQYKLIKLKKVEFDCPEINYTYADAVTQNDASRTIKDCSGRSIWIRNSGFSNFAGTKLAQGNGDLVALYTVYRTDKQLKIRDLNDVQLNDVASRCVTCSSSGGGGGDVSTIADIRALYTGNGVKLQNLYIEGTVISDKDTKNVDSKNLVLQDESGGIIVRFASAHSFSIGDKVKVRFSGDSLIKYAKLMEVDKVPLASATKIGSGTIVPKIATISDIKNNYNSYESTLVTIENATLSNGATFVVGTNGSRTITDASSNMTLYTLSGASFASTALPTGSKSVTGIVGIFNSTYQLSIRGLSDIQ